jgi:hypothetical protein
MGFIKIMSRPKDTQGLTTDMPMDMYESFMAYCKERDIKAAQIIRAHIRNLLAKASKKK